MLKSKGEKFLCLIWVLVSICLIKLPDIMKENFDLETGKKIVMSYILITVIFSLIYNGIKSRLKKNNSSF